MKRAKRDIHTYFHTYIHTFIHTYILSYIHTYILSYIHTYIHTFIHTYIHTYLHTDQPSHRISISWLKRTLLNLSFNLSLHTLLSVLKSQVSTLQKRSECVSSKVHADLISRILDETEYQARYRISSATCNHTRNKLSFYPYLNRVAKRTHHPNPPLTPFIFQTLNLNIFSHFKLFLWNRWSSRGIKICFRT